MAVLGELGVEGVEDFVVTKGEDLALEFGASARGEGVEAAEIEEALLPGSVYGTMGFRDHPVGMAPDGDRPEVHGRENAYCTYNALGEWLRSPSARLLTVHCRRGRSSSRWEGYGMGHPPLGGNPPIEAIAAGGRRRAKLQEGAAFWRRPVAPPDDLRERRRA